MESREKTSSGTISSNYLNQNFLERVFDESQESFVVLKAVFENNDVSDFTYELINKKAEIALGMTKESLIGKRLLDIFPGTYLDGIFNFYKKIYATGIAESNEFHYKHESFNHWFVQRVSKIDECHLLISTVDITEQKRAQFELSARNKELIAAQNINKSGNWTYNTATGISTWSDQVFRLFNEKPDSNKNTFEILEKYVFPEDLIQVRELAAEAIRNESGYQSTYRVKLEDGSVKVFSTHARASKNDSGELVLKGTCQDITERWRTNERLSSAEHFQKKIMQLVPGLISVYNIQSGKYIFINDAVSQMLGYSKQLLLDKGAEFLISLVHPDDLEGLIEKNSKALLLANDPSSGWQDTDPVEFEYRLKNKDGEYRWLVTTGLVFDRNEQGKVEHLINISFDITERKLNEEILQRNEALMNQAQQIALIGSWEWDIRNDRVLWTDTLYEMYGYKPNSVDVNYEFFITHVHPEDRELVDNAIKNSYATGKPFSFEHRLVQPSGAVRILVAKGNIILNEEQMPIRMVGVAHDITERREAELELRNATLDIETQRRLNEKKDEFIGMASHELKTPLTSLKAYMQLLDRHFSEKQQEPALTWLKRTSSYVEKLSALIADLLDISKINAGKLQFNLNPVSVQEIVTDTIEAVQQITNTHSIKIEGKTNAIILADKNRIEQVIINLLSNAIKYSPKAKEVFVKVEEDEKVIRISVKDQGIGIDDKNLSKIFDRFYRVDHISRQFSGLGIGLYISSEIIRRHDGRIWVESEEGKGSTFIVEIPRGRDSGSASEN